MVTGCSGFSVTHNLQFSLPPPVSAGFPYIVYTGAVGWGKVVGKKVKVHHRFTLQLSPVRFITYFVIIFM